ncbi:MAG: 30S ribosome-binding factor RbfA [Pseudomonadota bacterium]
MPREFHRSQRVGQQVHRLLGEIVQREIKDPRVGFATLTAVEVSRDIRYAKVYFSLLDENADPEEALEVLQGAAGYLRGLLGRELNVRSVPELKFLHDDSVRRGQRMSALIDSAVDADRRHAVERGADDADTNPIDPS